MSLFRIQRIPSQKAGERPKGFTRSYRFLRDHVPVYQCHVSPSCMKPTNFTPLDERQPTGFVLKPSRPVMPFTWIVEEKGSRKRFGTLKRKLFGKIDWKVHDPNGRQIAVFVGFYERRFWLIRFIDFFMGPSRPYRYEVVSQGETLATMTKELRPDAKPVQKKGLFARFLGKVLVEKDWVIEETEGKEERLDHRLIFSGAVLLEVVSRDTSGS